jgi:pyrroloquinoline-quinone synthase
MNKLSLPILETFHEVTSKHPLWNHEFLAQCRNSELTQAEVKILAVQMYKFCKEFNRILATIYSCCSDVTVQLVILENLCDEMGGGNPDLTHPALFRKFTRALGIDDQTLEDIPTAPETYHLVNTYMRIVHEYGYLAGLGAVCFASEGIVNTLYTQLQKGIRGAGTFSEDALIFFTLHVDLDGDHAYKMAQMIDAKVSTTEESIDINRAILEAMDARVEFFDGIQRQISRLYKSASLSPLMMAS